MDPEVFVVDLLIVLAAGLTFGTCLQADRRVTLGRVSGRRCHDRQRCACTGDASKSRVGILGTSRCFAVAFSVGIEFSLEELVRLSRYFLIGGAVQMILVAVPLTAACSGLWNDVERSDPGGFCRRSEFHRVGFQSPGGMGTDRGTTRSPSNRHLAVSRRGPRAADAADSAAHQDRRTAELDDVCGAGRQVVGLRRCGTARAAIDWSLGRA